MWQVSKSQILLNTVVAVICQLFAREHVYRAQQETRHPKTTSVLAHILMQIQIFCVQGLTYSLQPSSCTSEGDPFLLIPNSPSRILLCISWTSDQQVLWSKVLALSSLSLNNCQSTVWLHCYITIYNKVSNLVVSFRTLHNSRVLLIVLQGR